MLPGPLHHPVSDIGVQILIFVHISLEQEKGIFSLHGGFELEDGRGGGQIRVFSVALGHIRLLLIYSLLKVERSGEIRRCFISFDGLGFSLSCSEHSHIGHCRPLGGLAGQVRRFIGELVQASLFRRRVLSGLSPDF